MKIMKRNFNILATLAALVVAVSSCDMVDHTDEFMAPDEDAMLAPDRVDELSLYKVLEFDPMNTAGIDIIDELDFFSSYRFKIYYEDFKVCAVEITNDLPFSTYGFPIPEGKQEAYYNTTAVPYAIRLKDTDQVVATYLQGQFCISWQLGCEEISYKLNFKRAND